jgi:hypothetical protein
MKLRRAPLTDIELVENGASGSRPVQLWRGGWKLNGNLSQTRDVRQRVKW